MEGELATPPELPLEGKSIGGGYSGSHGMEGELATPTEQSYL